MIVNSTRAEALLPYPRGSHSGAVLGPGRASTVRDRRKDAIVADVEVVSRRAALHADGGDPRDAAARTHTSIAALAGLTMAPRVVHACDYASPRQVWPGVDNVQSTCNRLGYNGCWCTTTVKTFRSRPRRTGSNQPAAARR